MSQIAALNTLVTFLQALFYAGSTPTRGKIPRKVEFYLENFQEERILHDMSTVPYPAGLYIEIKNNLQITGAEYKEIMGHTWKTVQTKKADELMEAGYSEKLVAISKVWAQGISFFGDAKKFNHWLRQLNPFLDSKPIDLLSTISGSEIVADELERMYEGSLA